jgi:crossover junction endodeoxyribonuclease RusA
LLKLEFPWPPAELSPNARVHHQVKAKAVKQYRQDCTWITTCARAKAGYPNFEGELKVDMIFCKPSKRRMDIDNALASCKALLDGMATALRVDDSRFHLSIRFGEGNPGTIAVSVE